MSIWKNIAPAREQEMRAEDGQRYFAFLDYLGTRALYSQGGENGALLVDRRMELEHGVKIRLQPHIADRKVEIGVFSDTVLIAGPELEPVLDAAAQLLDFSLTKSLRRNKPEDIRLLRGGITKGMELRTSYLKAGPGVSVIPFFDTSLAFAYELEATRRGSRLFLGKEIVQEHPPGVDRYFSAPASMPGFGNATASASEFLWPAYIWRSEVDNLAVQLHGALHLWDAATKVVENPSHYRETTYHFDETIKLLIRSLGILSSDHPELLDKLAGYLPSEEHEDQARIRYLWGIWLQIALVLVQSTRAKEFADKLVSMRAVLVRHDYWDKFLAETDYAVYRPLRDAIETLI